MRRVLVLTTIGAVAAVALPFAVERVAQRVGPRLGPETDRDIAWLVAKEALFGAQMLDRKLARLIFPVHIVTRVWRDPGHCSDANSGAPFAEYRATVVALTWFAVPGSIIDVSCGGWLWSRRGAGPAGGRSRPPSSILPVRVVAPRDTGRYRPPATRDRQ
jgi:hypothetical protein